MSFEKAQWTHSLRYKEVKYLEITDGKALGFKFMITNYFHLAAQKPNQKTTNVVLFCFLWKLIWALELLKFYLGHHPGLQINPNLGMQNLEFQTLFSLFFFVIVIFVIVIIINVVKENKYNNNIAITFVMINRVEFLLLNYLVYFSFVIVFVIDIHIDTYL